MELLSPHAPNNKGLPRNDVGLPSPNSHFYLAANPHPPTSSHLPQNNDVNQKSPDDPNNKQQQQKLQNPAKDMSLLRTIATRAPRAPSAITTRIRFSTSPFARKDSSSAVNETIESVNKTVGNAAVKGIEKGQSATETLKTTVGLNAKQAEGSAKEMTGEAKGKASEVAGEAKGKTQEVAGQAKGKAEEVKGKM